MYAKDSNMNKVKTMSLLCKLCKHTVGISCREGLLEVTFQVRAIPLREKGKEEDQRFSVITA